jgi:septal ring factor EnvC (AmiA/AmiB activator)
MLRTSDLTRHFPCSPHHIRLHAAVHASQLLQAFAQLSQALAQLSQAFAQLSQAFAQLSQAFAQLSQAIAPSSMTHNDSTQKTRPS